MKIYNFSGAELSDQLQSFSKQIKDIDARISSIINYRDLVNPNYIKVNTEYSAGTGLHFYTTQALEYLNIIEENKIILNNLRPHQIFVNSYGQKLSISETEDSEAIDYLPEGFAIIRKNQDINTKKILYSIVSLDSSGAYYALNSIVNNSYNWRYLENATDEIGSNYLFTIVPEGVRFMYSENESGLYKVPPLLVSFIQKYAYYGSASILTTMKGTYWTSNQILGDEIITITQNSDKKYYEKIICDELTSTTQVNLNNSPVSKKIIKTNLTWKEIESEEIESETYVEKVNGITSKFALVDNDPQKSYPYKLSLLPFVASSTIDEITSLLVTSDSNVVQDNINVTFSGNEIQVTGYLYSDTPSTRVSATITIQYTVKKDISIPLTYYINYF